REDPLLPHHQWIRQEADHGRPDQLDAQGIYLQGYARRNVFETWHQGRAVLIGDALANRIYALPEHRTRVDIDQAFKAYRDERLPWVEATFNSSTMMKSMVQKVSSSSTHTETVM
ncbi:hypothetical protein BGZ91_003960, partial [Linnemannia elongata]